MRVLIMCLAVVAATGATASPSESIALVGDDAAFRAALEDALAPAGMAVTLVGDPPLTAPADIASTSRAIADREHATSTVWLVFSGSEATLIAYDRGVDRVLVRTLPYGSPLSAAAAAEAARTARTMLRALRVTPDIDLPPPRASEAATVRALALAPPPRVPAVPRWLAIELDGGIRVRGPGAVMSPSGTISAVLRPDTLGLAISARTAGTGAVDAPMFVGHISDLTFGALGRYPYRVARDLVLAPSAGLTLHLLDLRGALATGAAVQDTRWDPAVRIGVGATYELRPTIGVGLAVSADWLLRRQAYDAGTDTILVVPHLQLAAGLQLTVRIL